MPKTVFQALGFHNEKQLRFYADLVQVPDSDKMRPSELSGEIAEHLSRSQTLQRIYSSLDPIDRAFIAELLHADGYLSLDIFEVKHGGRPSIYRPGARHLTPLRLFTDHHEIHRDIRELLLEFIPPPHAVPPATIDVPANATVRLTEADALNDVLVLLNAISHGRLPVTAKTGMLGSAATKQISQLIRGGDLYATEECDPIRAFAWTVLLQSCGYTQVRNEELRLNEPGNRALLSAPADLLREVWYGWIVHGSYDEFKRLETLKLDKSAARKFGGYTSKARRGKVRDALAQCPPGKWISVDEFFSFIRRAGLHFELCRGEHGLLLFGEDIGGHEKRLYEHWHHAYGRYVLCFVMEYAATVGIVDIAYIASDNARDDFQHLPGATKVRALSRYDGLLAFRLTPLGEYILGISEIYEPPQTVAKQKLTVLSSLVLTFEEQPPAEQTVFLDLFAERESNSSWRLSREKTLAASQHGYPVKLLRDFMTRFDDQPLPETVDAFLEVAERNSQALHSEEQAILIECISAEIAEKIATNAATAQLALLAGTNQLVIRKKDELAFRRAVHSIGYGFTFKD